MSAFEAIVLGIVQGLTEFLPISSSAHVRIVPALFGWPDPGTAFTAVIQLGTMAAVLIYFRRDLLYIVRAFLGSVGDRSYWRSPDVDARTGWYLIIGTIPIAVIGLVLKDTIETGVRSLELIAVMLMLFSAVLWQADRIGSRTRELEQVDRRDAIVIGFAQALALIPGVSRSGATISFGLFQGFTREAAARFSFLLSVPAVVLSGLFELRKIGDGTGVGAGATLIATLFAFIFGYASIAWLLGYLRTHSLGIFIRYRLALGAFVLVLALAGAIS
ncbi:MAG: undecaprenyl-diphosphate phosphatase [Actinobacteria bacterium]|nr:undecaprenyl-diphosphate phosphatase [Actinomycetota bacterium]